MAVCSKVCAMAAWPNFGDPRLELAGRSNTRRRDLCFVDAMFLACLSTRSERSIEFTRVSIQICL